MRRALTLPVSLRRATFEAVSPLLALMKVAIEHSCRDHYDADQRRAVYLSYAQTLFVDVLQPLDTIVADRGGTLVGFAQLDRGAGRLRALFVAPATQGGGVGRTLLDAIERLASAAGSPPVHGAMSLNAVPFYAGAGYVPCPGRRHLVHGGVTVPVVPMVKG